MLVSAGLFFFILACIYIRPLRNIEASLDLLQQTIDKVNELHRHLLLVLTGDINAYIGSLDNIPEELVLGTTLTETRTSADSTIDTRGQKLLLFTQYNSMYFINGRSPSNSTGKFTFIGKSNSIIDFVIANI